MSKRPKCYTLYNMGIFGSSGPKTKLKAGLTSEWLGPVHESSPPLPYPYFLDSVEGRTSELSQTSDYGASRPVMRAFVQLNVIQLSLSGKGTNSTNRTSFRKLESRE